MFRSLRVVDIRNQTWAHVGAVTGQRVRPVPRRCFFGHILGFISFYYHMSLVGHLALLCLCLVLCWALGTDRAIGPVSYQRKVGEVDIQSNDTAEG